MSTLEILFYITAMIATISSILVIVQKNLIYSLLSMILTILSIAVIFLLLSAPLLAALQIIIYAGAIMILYLFVIMMLNLGEREEEGVGRFYPFIGLTFGGVLIVELGYILLSSLTGKGTVTGMVEELGPKRVGKTLFSDYSLAIELASLLLMIALIGAFYVARREVERSP